MFGFASDLSSSGFTHVTARVFHLATPLLCSGACIRRDARMGAVSKCDPVAHADMVGCPLAWPCKRVRVAGKANSLVCLSLLAHGGWWNRNSKQPRSKSLVRQSHQRGSRYGFAQRVVVNLCQCPCDVFREFVERDTSLRRFIGRHWEGGIG